MIKSYYTVVVILYCGGHTIQHVIHYLKGHNKDIAIKKYLLANIMAKYNI